MEAILGRFPVAFTRRADLNSKKYLKSNYRLAYPSPETPDESRRFVKSTKSLKVRKRNSVLLFVFLNPLKDSIFTSILPFLLYQ